MPGFEQLLAGGWIATIAIETAVLASLMSKRNGPAVRLFSGVWLSACTLPVVWLVLPAALSGAASRAAYLIAAETFAPLAECGLFWWAFVRPRTHDRRATVQDCAAIVTANMASFAIGEAAWRLLAWA